MKITCSTCNKEISTTVDKTIENFEPGRLICPHCHYQQKRYISEADLLMYFGIASIFYCLLISLFMLIYEILGFNIYSILIIVGLFIFSYFILKQITRFIYKNAPYKSICSYNSR